MLNIESLANNIAEKISVELNYDEDKRDIIAYGTFALIQTFFSIALIILFGKLFNVTIEALIISFIISLLRKSSGGAHASSACICAFLGTIVSVGLAIVVRVGLMINLYSVILMGVVTFILSYYIICKLAPVDSRAKPIKKEQRKKLLKKRSIIILSIYFIIVLCNLIGYYLGLDKRFIVYTLCIYSGVLWQVFTLTKFGHLVLNKVDSFFIVSRL